MSNGSDFGPANSETAGVRAIQEARRRVIEHIGSTSKELGNLAAQYGGIIANYQAELRQLDASLARLRPVSLPVNPSGDCDATGPASNLYNKY